MQQSVMRWEAAEGGLPSYVNEYARRLLATQAWIDQGGPDPTTNVPLASATPGPQPPTVPAISDGESEVDATEDGSGGQERPVVSKVQATDLIRHALDKGQWAATPAVRQGWRISVQVSTGAFVSWCLVLTPCFEGVLVWRPTKCVRCSRLGHECSGLAELACGRCQRDKKECADVGVEGKSGPRLSSSWL